MCRVGMFLTSPLSVFSLIPAGVSSWIVPLTISSFFWPGCRTYTVSLAQRAPPPISTKPARRKDFMLSAPQVIHHFVRNDKPHMHFRGALFAALESVILFAQIGFLFQQFLEAFLRFLVAEAALSVLEGDEPLRSVADGLGLLVVIVLASSMLDDTVDQVIIEIKIVFFELIVVEAADQLGDVFIAQLGGMDVVLTVFQKQNAHFLGAEVFGTPARFAVFALENLFEQGISLIWFLELSIFLHQQQLDSVMQPFICAVALGSVFFEQIDSLFVFVHGGIAAGQIIGQLGRWLLLASSHFVEKSGKAGLCFLQTVLIAFFAQLLDLLGDEIDQLRKDGRGVVVAWGRAFIALQCLQRLDGGASLPQIAQLHVGAQVQGNDAWPQSAVFELR